MPHHSAGPERHLPYSPAQLLHLEPDEHDTCKPRQISGSPKHESITGTQRSTTRRKGDCPSYRHGTFVDRWCATCGVHRGDEAARLAYVAVGPFQRGLAVVTLQSVTLQRSLMPSIWPLNSDACSKRHEQPLDMHDISLWRQGTRLLLTGDATQQPCWSVTRCSLRTARGN